MKSKEEILNILNIIRNINGSLTVYYIPESYIYDTKKCYDLYYSGANKFIIDKKYFEYNSEFIEITDNNLNKIVDKIIDILKNDIYEYLHKAVSNLKLEYEDFKYFENNKKTHKKFINEVLKLKNDSIQINS